MRKRIALALALLALFGLAGCATAPPPLAPDRQARLSEEFRQIDMLPTDATVRTARLAYEEQLGKARQAAGKKGSPDVGRFQVLVGYCWERTGAYAEAVTQYEQAGRSEYASVALFRIAAVEEFGRKDAKAAQGALNRLRTYAGGGPTQPLRGTVLVRDPELASAPPHPGGSWTEADLRTEVNRRLNEFNRTAVSYQVFAWLVRAVGNNPRWSPTVAIIVLALIVKLVTTPLMSAQIRSMRAMQAVQPEIKKLQEKHKGDRQQMMKAQMELFKQYGVNPLGGCLPMLVQLPILIWVYSAIRMYEYQFRDAGFIWVPSLAEPDLPLLIMYGVSMYFSSKLTATPSADPQQQQMQRMMTTLMPVMLFVFLMTFPAAFVLYWLLQNVLMTGHQYYALKYHPAIVPASAGAAPEGTSGGSPKGKAIGPAKTIRRKRSR